LYETLTWQESKVDVAASEVAASGEFEMSRSQSDTWRVEVLMFLVMGALELSLTSADVRSRTVSWRAQLSLTAASRAACA
jgi:hypothetical protein